MDELISKKEVLEKYGISYGALYRWKRMGLIPEDWFVKKSAVTGQETFFRRDVISERIETILKLKDTLSLEEIKNQLDGDADDTYTVSILWQNGSVKIPLGELKTISVSGKDGNILELMESIQKQITDFFE